MTKLNATVKELDLHEQIVKGTFDEQQKTKMFIKEMKHRYAQEM